MTNEEADISEYVTKDGGLYSLGHYMAWSPGMREITLDCDFTAAELRAIADHMDPPSDLASVVSAQLATAERLASAPPASVVGELVEAVRALVEYGGFDHHIDLLRAAIVAFDASPRYGVEEIARAVYDAMPYDGPGAKPAWVPRGNSLKQDDARAIARAVLALQASALPADERARVRNEVLEEAALFVGCPTEAEGFRALKTKDA
jgi:hypothetical protein